MIILLSGYACYAQKITADPNVRGIAKPVETDDVRLSQKVTYEAWHRPVKAILDDLSASTGVTLYAGYNTRDWQVRDRKMNICVTDVTLAALMNSIARVMKFKWSERNDATPSTYRLIADRKRIAELQAKASQLDQELKKEIARRRAGLVEALAEVAELSDAELEALRVSNPYLYWCSKTGFAKTLTRAFTDQPSLRDIFLKADLCPTVFGKYFSDTYNKTRLENYRKLAELRGSPLPSQKIEEELYGRETNFYFEEQPREHKQRRRLFDFGHVSTHCAEGPRILGWLRDPYAESSRAWGSAVSDTTEQRSSRDFGVAAAERKETEDIEKYFMMDPVTEHQDEADLHRTVVLEMSEEAKKSVYKEAEESGWTIAGRLMYEANLKALVKAAQINLVTDSYNTLAADDTSRIPRKDELLVILDKLTDAHRCNWEKHNSFIEICRRDWFRRRASQVPDEWVERWLDELKKKGMLSIDTFVQMVCLSEEQWEECIQSTHILDRAGGDYDDVRRNRQFCSFYMHLSSSQRSQLFSESGLDVGMLSNAQWQYYTDMFEHGFQIRWPTDQFTDLGAPVVITATKGTEADGSVLYDFTARRIQEDGSPREAYWQIRLRKIEIKKS